MKNPIMTLTAGDGAIQGVFATHQIVAIHLDENNPQSFCIQTVAAKYTFKHDTIEIMQAKFRQAIDMWVTAHGGEIDAPPQVLNSEKKQ
jgi:hypothetical protein